ncbi:Flp family type IVb pilin [Paraburkholderia sp.]|uniref:Flp family type IVb pilin n=1 Tax=Paraburkholderia sp. TaxID=1926495 RepID=UPI002F412082
MAGDIGYQALPDESVHLFFRGIKMTKFFKAFVRDERGVSALEYAILAGIIVVALTAVGTTFSASLQGIFTNLITKIQAAGT